MVFANLVAQSSVKQVIIGNGGVYGNPSDHVSITTFDPITQTVGEVGGVVRESIQDLVIHENFVYVTAEDSIVKFNLNTYQKVASLYESNLHRIIYHNGNLYVSRRSDINGPPADGIFLKVFNAEDLSLVASIEGISSDASGMVIAQDTLFLAVPGDWMATEGKMAVIDIQNFQLKRELNLGAEAVGLFDLFTDNSKVYTVNKSPYLANSGSVSTYDVITMNYSTSIFNHVVGKGVERIDHILYLGLDNGIGSYNLLTNEVLEASIVPDPGSVDFKYIAAAAFDVVNQLFYVTITDYFSLGEGKIFDTNGSETGTFAVGVSAEAISIDYEVESTTEEIQKTFAINIYPNPVSSQLNIKSEFPIQEISIFNLLNQKVKSWKVNINSHQSIEISELPKGVYLLQLNSPDGTITRKIVKE